MCKAYWYKRYSTIYFLVFPEFCYLVLGVKSDDNKDMFGRLVYYHWDVIFRFQPNPYKGDRSQANKSTIARRYLFLFLFLFFGFAQRCKSFFCRRELRCTFKAGGRLMLKFTDAMLFFNFFLLDTSFLEFCVKQSRSEAELLLIENLGSYDPDHEFIDKFLNYKDLLPADVLEIAFQTQSDRKVTGTSARDVNSDNSGLGDLDRDIAVGGDGPSKGGSKKKGKKGKKVSPSVLGFNVVSNRIMMGEIQTVED